MTDILLIVGLPGSGKTHRALELKGQDPTITLIDDLDRNQHLLDEFRASPTPRLIITDPWLTMTYTDRAETKLQGWFDVTGLSSISFQNDIEACWRNLQRREERRDISYTFIDYLSDYYEKSDWAKNIPVYKG